MRLRILLPEQIFVDQAAVATIAFETHGGSFGLLPHRRDCVAAIVPGLFFYQPAGKPEITVALDEGVLVKAGDQVLVSVRRAMAGGDIAQLQHRIAADFLTLTNLQQDQRRASAELETGFLKHFAAFEDA